MRKLILLGTIVLASTGYAWSQAGTAAKDKKETAAPAQQAFKSSPAYSELLLRRTETTAALESLVLEYTEEYPKVKELRYTLTLVDRESERISKVKPADQAKLTLALGKLLVRKIELETELWALLKEYKDEHPDVKRAKRRVEIFESAIAEVLN